MSWKEDRQKEKFNEKKCNLDEPDGDNFIGMTCEGKNNIFPHGKMIL